VNGESRFDRILRAFSQTSNFTGDDDGGAGMPGIAEMAGMLEVRWERVTVFGEAISVTIARPALSLGVRVTSGHV